jgi:16S rRNA (uracil1498-N3)-methyltransferase
MGHVPHLYLAPPWQDSAVELGDDHLHHLTRVLRLRDGDGVSYTDGAGVMGTGQYLAGRVERGEEHRVPRPRTVTLAVAPPSPRDRLRFLVEKAAELGVARLLWTRTAHTEGRPPPDDKARAWVLAALEQSRGTWLMELGTIDPADLDPADLVVADPGGAPEPPPGRHTVLVGPEGGLASGEIPEGAARLSLGSAVLRVETAAILASFALITGPGHDPDH